MKTGIELISQERQRQISKEGWTPAHDDGHTNGDMADAAACYAAASAAITWLHRPSVRKLKRRFTEGYELVWPWDDEWLKIKKDPIRNLVKAGALIAAEIDRLQRLKKSEAH